MDWITLTIIYLLAINAITFAVYGIDKLKAKRTKWRIPETTLLLLTVICLLYTSPSPRDRTRSRMPSSA